MIKRGKTANCADDRASKQQHHCKDRQQNVRCVFKFIHFSYDQSLIGYRTPGKQFSTVPVVHYIALRCHYFSFRSIFSLPVDARRAHMLAAVFRQLVGWHGQPTDGRQHHHVCLSTPLHVCLSPVGERWLKSMALAARPPQWSVLVGTHPLQASEWGAENAGVELSSRYYRDVKFGSSRQVREK